MTKDYNNAAFIDAANLHKGVAYAGWRLDYRKFRIWLFEKYGVTQAFIFIGYIPSRRSLYEFLHSAGYTLVFKEVTYGTDGEVKGNCDADLVLWAVRGVYENTFASSVLVSSDGDYASVVKFLIQKNRLKTIISPANAQKCSVLLKRTGSSIVYLYDKKGILQQA